MDLDAVSRAVAGLISAGVLVVFLPSVLVVVLLSGPVGRRWRTQRWIAALALGSLAAIVAVTFRERDVLLWSRDIGAALSCTDCDRLSWLTDSALWSRALHVQTGWLLNVALFVPAGFLVSIATRRPLRVLIGLVLLSALIELVQDLTGLGAPDPADLVANALGAAVGAIAAAVALRIRPPSSDPSDVSGLSHRSGVAIAVVLMIVLAVGWVGLLAGADARQRALRSELESAFAGTTAQILEAQLATSDGAGAVLRAIATRPVYLGRVGETDEFEGLYTTQLLGVYRCLTIRWSQSGFVISDGSDEACTTFRDRPPSS